jgi:hypothetical protein
MARALSALVALAMVASCQRVGSGDGWVAGSLWVEHCRSGQPLGPLDDFDLNADFFTGDPLFDASDATALRQSRLTVRIQETSNNIEETNGVLMQFQDLVQAAQAFAASEPMAFSDDSLCPGCTDINTALRMQLGLYVRCPDNRAPMAAGVFPLAEGSTGGTARPEDCLLLDPDAEAPPACPVLDDSERAALDAICEEADFNDRGHLAEIRELLGGDGRACMYLCSLGRARRGDDPQQLLGFEIDYGDRVAALFSAAIADTRAVRLGRCARAQGHLVGMLDFEVVRNRVAQPFP